MNFISCQYQVSIVIIILLLHNKLSPSVRECQNIVSKCRTFHEWNFNVIVRFLPSSNTASNNYEGHEHYKILFLSSHDHFRLSFLKLSKRVERWTAIYVYSLSLYIYKYICVCVRAHIFKLSVISDLIINRVLRLD